MKIRIHGISEGKSEIQLTENVKDIPDIFPEFFGEVLLEGTLTRYRNRFTFKGKASCNAKMICDYCLEEFVEKIEAEVSINIVADTNLFFMQKKKNTKSDDEIVLHEDDVYYDINNDVKDFLMLNLPMQRLSPDCKGKKFIDIYPEFSSQKENSTNEKPIDERWAGLKNIKFD
jgi:uncharacterized metal-binding protein YceD (DUF177 family)